MSEPFVCFVRVIWAMNFYWVSDQLSFWAHRPPKSNIACVSVVVVVASQSNIRLVQRQINVIHRQQKLNPILEWLMVGRVLGIGHVVCIVVNGLVFICIIYTSSMPLSRMSIFQSIWMLLTSDNIRLERFDSAFPSRFLFLSLTSCDEHYKRRSKNFTRL